MIKRNEELQLQVAELSILARIKQSEDGEEKGDSSEGINTHCITVLYDI